MSTEIPQDHFVKGSYGYFQKDGTEYVITEPNTPRGWMNYAWNKRFISAINQHGGGDGAYKERAMQYIDPVGRHLMVRDQHRYFYIRDKADTSVWSPGWHPVQAELDTYECAHGLGYSRIVSGRDGIRCSMRWFVPAEAPCEVWSITLTNEREQLAELQWFSFVDMLLGGYPVYCDYFSSLSGHFDENTGVVVACNENPDCVHEWYNGFLASDIPVAGFDTSHRRFLGNFGHVNAPEAVVLGACNNSLGANEKLVGALQHDVTLRPGETITFNVVIGACTGINSANQISADILKEGVIEAEFQALKSKKHEMVEQLRIETPVEKVNYLVNGWLKQQVQIYADVGSDNGRGFRDAMQLLWATASFDLEYTKRMLLECLEHQYAAGHTLRGWLPVDDHHYSDGPVWIAPVVAAFIKESGDTSILDEVVSFFDEGEGTVWEHTLRGLRHASEDLGPHGLIRCHFGDWNDSLTGIDLDGNGESVWTSIGIVYGLKVAAEISETALEDRELASELEGRAERLTEAIHKHGWDGDWFLRAINDLGEPVGSKENEEGSIWLLPQVWAVLAGIVDADKGEHLFKMVDKHLSTPYGFQTLAPAYTSVQKRVGRVTAMAPGMWENGTPYCHATGFKILADCVAGRGDAAFDTYMRVMPDNEVNPSTHSACEPYAFTNQYIGPDNPRAGETQFAWMTGAGGWFFRAMTEGILGVQADYNGLRIQPALPASWTVCKLIRSFRGARYDITIRNPEALQSGKVRLKVDGEQVDGEHAPVFNDGKCHEVEAVLHA